MNYTKMARKLRKRISIFSGELSAGLAKVCERFITEMVYGIQASQSVVLTKISRKLEERISIKKTEERLICVIHIDRFNFLNLESIQ